MRSKLLILIFSLGCLSSHAQSKNDIVVWKKDGSSFLCSLEEKPQISYSDKYYSIATSDSKTKILFTDIWKVTFYNEEANSVKSGLATKPVISVSNDYVVIKGTKANETITLFSVSGNLRKRVVADSNGYASFSVSALAAGVYIINTTFSSIKFIKK